MPHSASVGRSPITSNQFVVGQLPGAARLAEVGRDLGPQLVVADPDRAVQPGRREHRGAGSRSAKSRGSPRSPWPGPAARNASSQPSTSSTTGTPPQSSDRSVAITCRRRLVVRRPVDRQEDRVGALAQRDPQRHARADAELPGGVRRGRHHAALGRVAAAADDDRQPLELGVPQDLDGRDELVEVDVQHPLLAGRGVAPRLVDACPAGRR